MERYITQSCAGVTACLVAELFPCTLSYVMLSTKLMAGITIVFLIFVNFPMLRSNG